MVYGGDLTALPDGALAGEAVLQRAQQRNTACCSLTLCGAEAVLVWRGRPHPCCAMRAGRLGKLSDLGR